MILSFQTSLNTPSFYSSDATADSSPSLPAPVRDVSTGKEWLFSCPGPCCSFEAVTVKSDVTQLESLRYRPLPLQLYPQTALWFALGEKKYKYVVACVRGSVVWCLKSSLTWRCDPDPHEWSRLSGFSATASAVIHLQSILLVLPVAFSA